MDKDIERLEKQILQCEAQLANEDFIKRAPEKVIENVRNKLRDFSAELKVAKEIFKKSGNFNLTNVSEVYQFLLDKIGSDEKIKWHIQELRVNHQLGEFSVGTTVFYVYLEPYSEAWYMYVYNDQISEKEIAELYSVFKNFK